MGFVEFEIVAGFFARCSCGPADGLRSVCGLFAIGVGGGEEAADREQRRNSVYM
jgi:hypothetical protein